MIFDDLEIIFHSFSFKVEQILDIFDFGEHKPEDDQINFNQFHSKVRCIRLHTCLLRTLNMCSPVPASIHIYYCVNQSEQTCPFSKVLAFLNSGVDEERAVHVGSSMKERRKSISNSSTTPNSSSNMGERRSSMSNILERRSSFSNTSSGHSPPSSNMLSPPPAVQVCFALLIINFHVIQTCMKRVNALCFES